MPLICGECGEIWYGRISIAFAEDGDFAREVYFDNRFVCRGHIGLRERPDGADFAAGDITADRVGCLSRSKCSRFAFAIGMLVREPGDGIPDYPEEYMPVSEEDVRAFCPNIYRQLVRDKEQV